MSRPLTVVLVLAAAISLSCKSDEDCPSGQTLCNGVCRDAAYFQTSAGDCGACGVECGAGTCVAGACECDPGATHCGSNPRCADLQNDPRNCGGCGVACTKPGSTCAAGACGCNAPASTDCGDFCADIESDASNCGGCGVACPLANDVCRAGGCTCPESLPDTCPLVSPTACVSLATDERNCGACGHVCATGATCTGATPECRCPGTEVVCGENPGACRDLASDESNCGACGKVCPAGATCTGTPASCACPSAQPVTCGSRCCAGTACCAGNACQTEHSNGVNGSYHDCGALDQHTAAQARLAAESWSPTGTTVELVPQCSTPFCLCRETSSQAAVWCYAGSPDTMRGHVVVTPSPSCRAATCPFAASLAWH